MTLPGPADPGPVPTVEQPASEPQILGATPRVWVNTRELTLTLDGDSFTSGATVSVGGVDATAVTVLSGTRLLATVPALPDAFGFQPVTVKNPSGLQATRSDLLRYETSAFPFRIPQFGARSYSWVVVGDFNQDRRLVSSPVDRTRSPSC
jgi:hypothetical protein